MAVRVEVRVEGVEETTRAIQSEIARTRESLKFKPIASDARFTRLNKDLMDSGEVILNRIDQMSKDTSKFARDIVKASEEQADKIRNDAYTLTSNANTNTLRAVENVTSAADKAGKNVGSILHNLFVKPFEDGIKYWSNLLGFGGLDAGGDRPSSPDSGKDKGNGYGGSGWGGGDSGSPFAKLLGGGLKFPSSEQLDSLNELLTENGDEIFGAIESGMGVAESGINLIEKVVDLFDNDDDPRNVDASPKTPTREVTAGGSVSSPSVPSSDGSSGASSGGTSPSTEPQTPSGTSTDNPSDSGAETREDNTAESTSAPLLDVPGGLEDAANETPDTSAETITDESGENTGVDSVGSESSEGTEPLETDGTGSAETEDTAIVDTLSSDNELDADITTGLTNSDGSERPAPVGLYAAEDGSLLLNTEDGTEISVNGDIITIDGIDYEVIPHEEGGFVKENAAREAYERWLENQVNGAGTSDPSGVSEETTGAFESEGSTQGNLENTPHTGVSHGDPHTSPTVTATSGASDATSRTPSESPSAGSTSNSQASSSNPSAGSSTGATGSHPSSSNISTGGSGTGSQPVVSSVSTSSSGPSNTTAPSYTESSGSKFTPSSVYPETKSPQNSSFKPTIVSEYEAPSKKSSSPVFFDTGSKSSGYSGGDTSGATLSRAELEKIIQEGLDSSKVKTHVGGGDYGGAGTGGAAVTSGVDAGIQGGTAAGSIGTVVGTPVQNGPIDTSQVTYEKPASTPLTQDQMLIIIGEALDINQITDPMARSKYAGVLMYIAEHESSFNPAAGNNWDTNAIGAQQVDGLPSQSSRGLFQFIPSSFASSHMAGTSTSIYDPLAGAAACIRYLQTRHGCDKMGNGLDAFYSARYPTYHGY